MLSCYICYNSFTWTCSFSTLLVSVTVLVQWSLNLLQRRCNGWKNCIRDVSSTADIIDCLLVGFYLFKYCWTHILVSPCVDVSQQLESSRWPRVSVQSERDAAWKNGWFGESKNQSNWFSLVTVRVFCNENKSCEPVRHWVNQIPRQAKNIGHIFILVLC